MPAVKHYRSAMRTKNVDTLWSPNSGLRYGKNGSQRWKERELKKAFNKIFSAWRLVLVDEWHRSRSPFCRPGVQFLEVMVFPIFFFCRHCCYYFKLCSLSIHDSAFVFQSPIALAKVTLYEHLVKNTLSQRFSLRIFVSNVLKFTLDTKPTYLHWQW